MANIKSAEKKHRQSLKRAERNRVARGSTRTAIKKARIAIESGDPNALQAVMNAESALDRAAAKGVIHPNNASRRKSRLYLALNQAQAQTPA